MSRATRPLLTVAQVARRLGVTPHSLATRRCLGNGPPYIVVGPKLIRYDADALDAWLQARTRTETVKRKPRSVNKAKASPAEAPTGGAAGSAEHEKALTRTSRQGLATTLSPSILEPSREVPPRTLA